MKSCSTFTTVQSTYTVAKYCGIKNEMYSKICSISISCVKENKIIYRPLMNKIIYETIITVLLSSISLLKYHKILLFYDKRMLVHLINLAQKCYNVLINMS